MYSCRYINVSNGSYVYVYHFLLYTYRYSQFVPTGSASTGGIRALRAVRALRPLRTITRFSSLRAIVVCFIEALPLLATLMAFLMFLFFLFALVGMMLFQEAFHHACIHNETGTPAQGVVEGSVRACGYRACDEGYTCQQSDVAYTSTAPGFDNIGLAMLTVFEVTSISGWAYTMYQCSDGVHPAALVRILPVWTVAQWFGPCCSEKEILCRYTLSPSSCCAPASLSIFSWQVCICSR